MATSSHYTSKQLDELKVWFDLNATPSRRQVDSISEQLGLKSAMVWVWFHRQRIRVKTRKEVLSKQKSKTRNAKVKLDLDLRRNTQHYLMCRHDSRTVQKSGVEAKDTTGNILARAIPGTHNRPETRGQSEIKVKGPSSGVTPRSRKSSAVVPAPLFSERLKVGCLKVDSHVNGSRPINLQEPSKNIESYDRSDAASQKRTSVKIRKHAPGLQSDDCKHNAAITEPFKKHKTAAEQQPNRTRQHSGEGTNYAKIPGKSRIQGVGKLPVKCPREQVQAVKRSAASSGLPSKGIPVETSPCKKPKHSQEPSVLRKTIAKDGNVLDNDVKMLATHHRKSEVRSDTSDVERNHTVVKNVDVVNSPGKVTTLNVDHSSDIECKPNVTRRGQAKDSPKIKNDKSQSRQCNFTDSNTFGHELNATDNLCHRAAEKNLRNLKRRCILQENNQSKADDDSKKIRPGKSNVCKTAEDKEKHVPQSNSVNISSTLSHKPVLNTTGGRTLAKMGNENVGNAQSKKGTKPRPSKLAISVSTSGIHEVGDEKQNPSLPVSKNMLPCQMKSGDREENIEHSTPHVKNIPVISGRREKETPGYTFQKKTASSNLRKIPLESTKTCGSTVKTTVKRTQSSQSSKIASTLVETHRLNESDIGRKVSNESPTKESKSPKSVADTKCSPKSGASEIGRDSPKIKEVRKITKPLISKDKYWNSFDEHLLFKKSLSVNLIRINISSALEARKVTLSSVNPPKNEVSPQKSREEKSEQEHHRKSVESLQVETVATEPFTKTDRSVWSSMTSFPKERNDPSSPCYPMQRHTEIDKVQLDIETEQENCVVSSSADVEKAPEKTNTKAMIGGGDFTTRSHIENGDDECRLLEDNEIGCQPGLPLLREGKKEAELHCNEFTDECIQDDVNIPFFDEDSSQSFVVIDEIICSDVELDLSSTSDGRVSAEPMPLKDSLNEVPFDRSEDSPGHSGDRGLHKANACSSEEICAIDDVIKRSALHDKCQESQHANADDLGRKERTVAEVNRRTDDHPVTVNPKPKHAQDSQVTDNVQVICVNDSGLQREAGKVYTNKDTNNNCQVNVRPDTTALVAKVRDSNKIATNISNESDLSGRQSEHENERLDKQPKDGCFTKLSEKGTYQSTELKSANENLTKHSVVNASEPIVGDGTAFIPLIVDELVDEDSQTGKSLTSENSGATEEEAPSSAIRDTDSSMDTGQDVPVCHEKDKDVNPTQTTGVSDLSEKSEVNICTHQNTDLVAKAHVASRQIDISKDDNLPDIHNIAIEIEVCSSTGISDPKDVSSATSENKSATQSYVNDTVTYTGSDDLFDSRKFGHLASVEMCAKCQNTASSTDNCECNELVDVDTAISQDRDVSKGNGGKKSSDCPVGPLEKVDAPSCIVPAADTMELCENKTESSNEQVCSPAECKSDSRNTVSPDEPRNSTNAATNGTTPDEISPLSSGQNVSSPVHDAASTDARSAVPGSLAQCSSNNLSDAVSRVSTPVSSEERVCSPVHGAVASTKPTSTVHTDIAGITKDTTVCQNQETSKENGAQISQDVPIDSNGNVVALCTSLVPDADPPCTMQLDENVMLSSDEKVYSPVDSVVLSMDITSADVPQNTADATKEVTPPLEIIPVSSGQDVCSPVYDAIASTNAGKTVHCEDALCSSANPSPGDVSACSESSALTSEIASAPVPEAALSLNACDVHDESACSMEPHLAIDSAVVSSSDAITPFNDHRPSSEVITGNECEASLQNNDGTDGEITVASTIQTNASEIPTTMTIDNPTDESCAHSIDTPLCIKVEPEDSVMLGHSFQSTLRSPQDGEDGHLICQQKPIEKNKRRKGLDELVSELKTSKGTSTEEVNHEKAPPSDVQLPYSAVSINRNTKHAPKPTESVQQLPTPPPTSIRHHAPAPTGRIRVNKNRKRPPLPESVLRRIQMQNPLPFDQDWKKVTSLVHDAMTEAQPGHPDAVKGCAQVSRAVDKQGPHNVAAASESRCSVDHSADRQLSVTADGNKTDPLAPLQQQVNGMSRTCPERCAEITPPLPASDNCTLGTDVTSIASNPILTSMLARSVPLNCLDPQSQTAVAGRKPSAGQPRKRRASRKSKKKPLSTDDIAREIAAKRSLFASSNEEMQDIQKEWLEILKAIESPTQSAPPPEDIPHSTTDPRIIGHERDPPSYLEAMQGSADSQKAVTSSEDYSMPSIVRVYSLRDEEGDGGGLVSCSQSDTLQAESVYKDFEQVSPVPNVTDCTTSETLGNPSETVHWRGDVTCSNGSAVPANMAQTVNSTNVDLSSPTGRSSDAASSVVHQSPAGSACQENNAKCASEQSQWSGPPSDPSGVKPQQPLTVNFPTVSPPAAQMFTPILPSPRVVNGFSFQPTPTSMTHSNVFNVSSILTPNKTIVGVNPAPQGALTSPLLSPLLVSLPGSGGVTSRTIANGVTGTTPQVPKPCHNGTLSMLLSSPNVAFQSTTGLDRAYTASPPLCTPYPPHSSPSVALPVPSVSVAQPTVAWHTGLGVGANNNSFVVRNANPLQQQHIVIQTNRNLNWINQPPVQPMLANTQAFGVGLLSTAKH